MAGDQDRSNSVDVRPDDTDIAPPAPPCTMVIFGAAGDLTKRLVVPALYNLSRSNRLSDGFRIVGVDLADQTTEAWRHGLTEMMHQFVVSGDARKADQLDEGAWRFLTDCMSYLQGDLTDPGTYNRLGEHLATLDKEADAPGNHMFYLAIADRFFSIVVAGLGAAGLTVERRINGDAS